VQEIAEWLEKLGMSEYALRFAENRIDFFALPDLTDSDLKDLGVVLGDRRKIMRAIAKLDAAPEAAVQMAKPPSTLSVAAVQSLPIAEESSERRDVTPYGSFQESGDGHPRANYHRLLARAVKGLDRNIEEARQVVYERARKALMAHLRSNQPRLLRADIVKERLAFEDAIREVEAEAAGESQTETSTESQAAKPPAGAPNVGGASEPSRQGNGNPAPTDMPEARWPAVLPSGHASLERVRGLRDVVREVHDFGSIIGTAAQTGSHAREVHEEKAVEPDIDPCLRVDFDTRQEPDLEPGYEPENEQQIVCPPLRHISRSAAPEDERTRRSLPYCGLARPLLAVIMVTGVVATVFWQWSAIAKFYQFLNRTGSNPQDQVSHKTPSAQSKISGRITQQQSSADSQGAAVPSGQTVPFVGQRVVLYEEDPTDPQGKRYTGSVIWRTETVSTKPRLAPELAVRADVTIPERRMAMTWSLRRSTDKGVPASYTIETTFNLPSDLLGGGIANVPGILMKQSEQAPGTELAGLAVKVMNGYFVIGLSADDTDMQRNEQLLKDRSWFDIPIVYTNGVRAVLAMEKGSQGDRTFAEAFAAWEKK
jgi:hypothetical protein